MAKSLCIAAAAAALLVAAGPALASPALGSRPTVRTLAAEEARLAGMAYRMASANAALCGRTEMMTGLILHDLTQYQPSKRADISRAFSLHGGFGVLQIIPGSAAARAGLRIDDEIVAVGSLSVDDPAAGQQPDVSFRRTQAFSDILQERLARGPAELRVRRNGQLQSLNIAGERGCGGQLSISTSGSLNAWSDGGHIVLTTGMKEFARTDDEIAFVIAHEMAHNILGHFGGGAKMGIFGVARSRNYELEADGYAVRLMNGAGFQPTAGLSFLKRSQQRLWWAFSLDHPGFGSRMRTVAAEIGREQQVPAYRQALLISQNSGPAPVVLAAPAGAQMLSATSSDASTMTDRPRLPSDTALLGPPRIQASAMWVKSATWRVPGRFPQP